MTISPSKFTPITLTAVTLTLALLIGFTADTYAQGAKKQQLIQKTNRMTQQILERLKSGYGIAGVPEIPNQPFCRKDGFCAINANEIYITIFGAGIVEIETTTQKPHSEYRKICSAAFSAISNSSLGFASPQIEAAFIRASQAGSAKRVLNNVEIKIKPDSRGVLGCRFFKYGY